MVELPPVQIIPIVDALSAALMLALDVPVFDGPPSTEALLTQAVIVGYDGISDEGRAGSFSQQYAHLGLEAQRDEAGEIVCAVFAQSGDASYRTLRARVLSIMADIQATLRTDPTLGLDWVQRVEVSGGELFAGDADGNAVRLALRITYTART